MNVGLIATPQIGVSKTATVNGSDVTFDFYLENLGTLDLSSVTLSDNLDSVFGAGNYTLSSTPTWVQNPGTLILNPDYDGSSDAVLIRPDNMGPDGRDEGEIENSTLVVGSLAQFRLTVSVGSLTDQGFGVGNYRNQVTANAESAGSGPTSDLSDDGVDPDPNGDGNPNQMDENDPTDFSLIQSPVIGLAKEVVTLEIGAATIDVGGMQLGGLGQRVRITWYLENLGNVDLSNLTLIDDLNAVFGAGNYGTVVSMSLPELTLSGNGSIFLNTSYNGSTQTDVLLPGSTLSPAAVAQIRTELIVINVTDQGMGVGLYSNQASTSAEGPGGGMTSDLSDWGNQSDPNGNGDPTESMEDDPTLFSIGSYIGAAKTASVGINQVTFDLYLENFGNLDLSNLSVIEDLASVFGVGNFSVSSPPSSLVADPGTIALNLEFDGSSETNLLSASSSLVAGATAQIRFVVTVQSLINRGMGLGVYSNQVEVSADQSFGATVSDLSDSGSDPDPTGDGDPNTPSGNENDPTSFSVLTDALVGVAKTTIVSGTEVTVDLYLEAFGSTTSNSVSLTDDLDAVFGSGNYAVSSPPALIDDPGTLFLNNSFNGNSDKQILEPTSTLAASDTAQIRFVVSVDTLIDSGLGLGVYENQAAVSAIDSKDILTLDLSDQGTDPDPNGDGDPTHPDATESDPTIFVLGDAAIGAALFSYVTGNLITYDYYIENLSAVKITGIDIFHDLNAVFGAGNFTAEQPILLDGTSPSMTPLPLFDGNSMTQLVSDGMLEPGESVRIRFWVNVTSVTDQGNGLGVYANQFSVSGIVPDGSTITDLSDDGILTDPNGNGNPSESGEDDPTVSIIGEETRLGIALAATANNKQATLEFHLENVGNSTVSNLSLREDLAALFGAGNYTILNGPVLIAGPMTITLNPIFDGGFGAEIFSGTSSLAPSETAHIRLNIEVLDVEGDGSFEEQVIASGVGPSGTVAQDRSDNGTDPDPNGNGNPADAGESDPTPFEIANPIVGIAKNATVSGAQVTFDLYLENLGNQSLDGLRIVDDLDSVFGAGQYTLIAPPALVDPTSGLLLNSNFNGSADSHLLVGGSLAIGASDQIQIVVRVDEVTDRGSGFGVYSNQTIVSASDSYFNFVSDLSDNGTNPDANGNFRPADSGEDDPTEFNVLVDFGDAPDPTYPTLLANDGARHTVGGPLILGATVDSEVDGQPTGSADGDSADEDGVSFLPIPGTSISDLVPGEMALVDVVSSRDDALLNGWVDFNSDGDWEDPGEQVFSDQSMIAGSNVLTFPVPLDAQLGTTFARFRIDSNGGLLPTGSATDGEVEDERVTVVGLDYGDAPDPTYPSLVSSNGARHILSSGPILGASIDGDIEGQPSANSNGDDLDSEGDDEDGIVFASPLLAGQPLSATAIVAGGSGFLNAWIDFDGNGSWADPGEQIALDLAVTAGANTVPFIVPATATLGVAFARFRVDSQGGLSYDGLAGNGEVEDSTVEISPAADLAVQKSVNEPNPILGATVEFTIEVINNGPNPASGVLMEDLLPAGLFYQEHESSQGTYDESTGIWTVGALADLEAATLEISARVIPDASSPMGPGGFINNTARVLGLDQTDPNTSNNEDTAGVDYTDVDFGDAPDPLYPTLLTNDGPRHAIPSGRSPIVYLGDGLDADLDGKPDGDATGDDLDGTDDEDGLVFPHPLFLGSATEVIVDSSAGGRLDYFFDFNQDGSFESGPDEIFNFVHPGSGEVAVPVVVPVTAELGATFARFRISTVGGLASIGSATDGEVEDYGVEILGVTPVLICPSDRVVENDPGQCMASVSFESVVGAGLPIPTVECAIDGIPITSPYTFPTGTTIVSCTATNEAGVDSCSFSVTVEDVEDPVATCQPLVAFLDEIGSATIEAASVDFGSTDNCGIASLIVSPTAFFCADIGIQEVTLTVVDLSGNVAFCTGTVQIVDNSEPLVMLPTLDPIVADETGAIIPDYTGLVTVSDNCTQLGDLLIGQVPEPGSLVGPGVANIVITVTDESGNASSAAGSLQIESPTPTETPTPSLTETPTQTPSPTPTEEQDCDSGYYLLDSMGGRHRVGHPPLIAGPVYFGTDVARDLERANPPALLTVDPGSLVVLDAFGAAHFVGSGGVSQEFYFAGESFRAVDLAMATDSAGFWVLADNGTIWRAGSAKEPSDPALLPGTDLGVLGNDVPLPVRDPNLNPGGVTLRAVSLLVVDENLDSRAEGYIVLDSMGGRFHFDANGDPVIPGTSSGLNGNEPERLLDPAGYAWPFFVGLDIARDMELHPSQSGVVILDGWGGIHPVPVDVETNPVFFANNIVSASDPAPNQAVGMPYIVTGFDDPSTREDELETLDIDGASIFADLEYSAGCSNSALYTLDKFGGIFVLGTARPDDNVPVPGFGGSPYFFPFQYAEDLELFSSDETGFE